MAPDTQSIDFNAILLTMGPALALPFDDSFDRSEHAGGETLSARTRGVDDEDEDVDEDDEDDEEGEDEGYGEEEDEDYEDDEEDEDEDDDLDDDEEEEDDEELNLI
jgi:hypothetical protein